MYDPMRPERRRPDNYDRRSGRERRVISPNRAHNLRAENFRLREILSAYRVTANAIDEVLAATKHPRRAARLARRLLRGVPGGTT